MELIKPTRFYFEQVGSLSVCCRSYQGGYHIQRQLSNQDHFAYTCKTEPQPEGFITIGDGLGSCQFSEEGSQHTTEEMRNFSVDVNWDEEAFKRALQDHISKKIRDELERLANAKPKQPSNGKVSLSDFATTLLFVTATKNKLFCAQVGDGALYLVRTAETQLLLAPTKGEWSEITVPITHPQWQDYLFTKVMDVPEDALFICMMTDGFADNINEPSLFFQTIETEIRQKTAGEFQAWLDDLNEYYESHGLSHDDKTIAFLFFQDLFIKKEAP